MITSVDLYGRSSITAKEKKRLQVANMTAKSIYEKRSESPYKEEFGEDASIITIEQKLIRVLQAQICIPKQSTTKHV
jgi:hypothetical protein